MRIAWQIFNIIAAVASIASLVFAIVNKAEYATLSFHIFLAALFTTYILFKIYDLKILKRDKYQRILVFYRWVILDQFNAQYDAFKIIKSNRPYLPSVEFKHLWTGRGEINNVSNQPLLNKTIHNSTISITYPVALYLNEYKAIHYTINTVDKDNKQCPYINCGGKNKIEMLILEVFFPNIENMPDAKIYVTPVNGNFHSGEHIDNVKFNPITHSYHWELLNFPGDCRYWLVWGEDKKFVC